LAIVSGALSEAVSGAPPVAAADHEAACLVTAPASAHD
jgi:hypothetical protein